MQTIPKRRIGGFSNLLEASAYSAKFPNLGLSFFDGLGQEYIFYSYTQLWKEAKHSAAYLKNRYPLPEGARVGLLAQTDAEFITHFLACQLLRWIPCPMPLPSALQAKGRYQQVLSRMLEAAGISLMLSPEQLLCQLPLHSMEKPIAVGAYEASHNFTFDDNEYFPDIAPLQDDIAYVQFSSGSTSLPKGIAISHRALMANVDSILQCGMQLTENDRAFSWLPFYHDMGLVGMLLAPLCAQVCVDYIAPTAFVRRPHLWTTLMSQQISTITYAPSFGYALAANAKTKALSVKLNALRIAGVGGDRIHSADLKSFSDNFFESGFAPRAFRPSYGLAEATLAVSIFNSDRCDASGSFLFSSNNLVEKVNSETPGAQLLFNCGKPLDGWQLSIIDKNGKNLPLGQQGQISVLGPSQMSGVFENGKLRLHDNSIGILTGDIGFLDTDGSLYISGRIKELMIVRGKNIWPQDIEKAISEALNCDAEHFFIFQNLHSPQNKDIYLLVHEKALRKISSNENIQSIQRLAASLLGTTPSVHIVANGSIERTSSGKIARRATRERFLNDKSFQI